MSETQTEANNGTLKSRSDLFRLLAKIQNSVEFRHTDIMTIAGCRPAFTDLQLADHIRKNFRVLSRERKEEVLQFARELERGV